MIAAELVGRYGKCECRGWAWGPSHLRRGALYDARGNLHHPSCKCPAGVIGCRGGTLPDFCSIHSTRRTHR